MANDSKGPSEKPEKSLEGFSRERPDSVVPKNDFAALQIEDLPEPT